MVARPVAEVEAVNPWWSLVAPLVALVGSVLIYRASRKDTDKNGEGGFRDDLLQRIEQQDRRIVELERRVEERDRKISELQTDIGQMQADLRHQRDVNADQLAHITVLTDWGINAPGGPPRTPPHWRQVQ